MNIVLVGTYDISGGAAKAMYRLHKGLRAIGENSYILTLNKKSNDPYVMEIESEYEDKIIFESNNRWYNYYLKNKKINSLFTVPFFSQNISELDIIKKADIINLHWVANFLSPEDIYNLQKLNKPIFWTLHDMRPFTGGCHYSFGCEHFKYNCLECKYFDNDLNILHINLKLQKKFYGDKRINIITPSKWLAKLAKKSNIFKNSLVYVISNGLELNIFKPYKKIQVRKELGLNFNKKYILFGFPHNAYYKGYDLLVRIIKNLNVNNNIEILSFGVKDDEINKLGVNIKHFGKIDNEKELAKIYSVSDLFILPSREDNLPNTMLESIACGTPVIGFNIGGIPDVITNYETGYLIKPFDIDEFCKKILEILFNENLLRYMRQKCVEFAQKNFSIELQALKYKELFYRSCKSNQKEKNNSFLSMNKKDKVRKKNYYNFLSNVKSRKEPYVSILVFDTGQKKLLENTLESVLEQKYDNKEVIIIEDNKNEFSKLKFKKNIKMLCCNEEDFSKKINYGIKFAKGEWGICLFSGDRFVDSYILKKVFINNEIEKYDIITGEYYTKAQKLLNLIEFSEEINKINLEVTTFQSIFFKVSKFKKFNLDEILDGESLKFKILEFPITICEENNLKYIKNKIYRLINKFKNLIYNKKVVFWGIGNYFNCLYELLGLELDNENIILVDNDKNKIGKYINNKKIEESSIIKDINYDIIFITVHPRYHEQIINQLTSKYRCQKSKIVFAFYRLVEIAKYLKILKNRGKKLL